MDTEILTVGIVGIGRMGGTIALALVEAQVTTLLKSTRLPSNVLRQLIDRFSKTHKAYSVPKIEEILSTVRILDSFDGLRNADLVIECVPEDFAVKQAIFGRLEKVCRPDTVFATNTSSLSVQRLALTTERPHRFVGLHFFNPADKMPLVEMITLPITEDDVRDNLVEFLSRIGKCVIKVRDLNGFIVNRLLFAMIVEAIRLIEAEAAAIEDIDAAMKLGANHPMGPLELADFIGLDICFDILKQLSADGSEHYTPPKLLREMIERGQCGRKTGFGFYHYR